MDSVSNRDILKSNCNQPISAPLTELESEYEDSTMQESEDNQLNLSECKMMSRQNHHYIITNQI